MVSGGRTSRRAAPRRSHAHATLPPSSPLPQHNWTVQNKCIIFQEAEKAGGPGKEGPPPLKLINNALMYAKELERIV